MPHLKYIILSPLLASVNFKQIILQIIFKRCAWNIVPHIYIHLFQVAWFVSNCHPRNQRMHYAKELSKYIQVDIYGTCGALRCPRSQSQACFDMLDEDYKFYLAFENSNCKDYITEKFFVNGLGYDIFLFTLSLS